MGKELSMSQQSQALLREQIRKNLKELEQDRAETQASLGGVLGVDARLFQEILTRLLTLESTVKSQNSAILDLQTAIGRIQLANKSRNISPADEKNSEVNSRILGAKSREEQLALMEKNGLFNRKPKDGGTGV
jgi:hypothetical protein